MGYSDEFVVAIIHAAGCAWVFLWLRVLVFCRFCMLVGARFPSLRSGY